MVTVRDDAAAFIAEWEFDIDQGRSLTLDASAESVNLLERALADLDRQAERIRELEGALRECADVLEESLYPGSRFGRIDTQDGGGALNAARRVLSEGSVKA